MRIRHNRIAFDGPDGKDDTIVLLVDTADPPAWNLTVKTSALAGTFSAFVEAQRPAHGAVVDKRSERAVAGKKALVVESHLVADALTLRQHQAFIHDETSVVVITMSAKESHASIARSAFDRALATLAWEGA